jgi:hypothetical protein
MDMYSFVPSFREAKFCGVPSCVFDKLGCVAGEEKVAEHCLRVRMEAVSTSETSVNFYQTTRRKNSLDIHHQL